MATWNLAAMGLRGVTGASAKAASSLAVGLHVAAGGPGPRSLPPESR